ncbi:hypothetical protein FSP39_003807 [Pinctada imbricata]|uniref:Uncharacterized protein n=1 Tax=Pinctada imbricata TaxID=66713 RepID=A0AA88YHK7_PINIB|nr:hypothetical protein FSP39_003807 [Pinctada imbricata]
MEAAMLRKRAAYLEQKLLYMKKMCEEAERHKKKKLSTKLIRDMYDANNADSMERCLKLIPQEKGKYWYVCRPDYQS